MSSFFKKNQEKTSSLCGSTHLRRHKMSERQHCVGQRGKQGKRRGNVLGRRRCGTCKRAAATTRIAHMKEQRVRGMCNADAGGTHGGSHEAVVDGGVAGREGDEAGVGHEDCNCGGQGAGKAGVDEKAGDCE